MENYVLKAAKEGILFLYDLAYENNAKIKNYIVDKEQEVITIKYMNGSEVQKKLENVDLDSLRTQQINEFRHMKDKILRRAKYQMVFTGGAFVFYTFAAGLLYSTEYYLEGSAYAIGSVTFFTFAYKNYKLRRHMNLVEWVCKNDEKVNEVIRQEVEEAIDSQVIDEETISMPIYNYPYSEEIYKEGINLNNISTISDGNLKKIKRRVLYKNNRG